MKKATLYGSIPGEDFFIGSGQVSIEISADEPVKNLLTNNHFPRLTRARHRGDDPR